MGYANIDYALSAADKAAVKNKLNEAKALLPFLVNPGLTAIKARRRLGKKGNTIFKLVIDTVKAQPNYMPPYKTIGEVERDFQLLKDVAEVEAYLEVMLDAVVKTRVVLEKEMLSHTTVIRKNIAGAEMVGLPGSSDAKAKLDELFKKGKRKPKAEKPQ